MDERDRGRISPEIYVYATNKNFLNVYDALRIDKIKVEVAGYDQATGKQTGLANAWLDVDDMRLLAHLVVTRLFKDVLPKARFEKFGGSERDGVIESRTLVLEWDPGENGRFANYPYRLTIANGPGLRTPTGAVQPKGEPTNKQSMRLPEADVMKIFLAVQAYIQAYEAAHHHRLVAAKVRELQDKLAERAANGNHRPAPAETAAPGSLRVVRDAPAPIPVRERNVASAPQPERERTAERVAAAPTRPAPTNGARPNVTTPAATLRPAPQSAGNAALAVAPDLEERTPPARTPLHSVESTRPVASAPPRPGTARPAPAAVPTTASRPATSPPRPFRSSTGG